MQGYIKKRWYKECKKTLALLENAEAHIAPLYALGDRYSGSWDQSTTTRLLGKVSATSLLYHELCARNYFHAKKYNKALVSVESAISLCAHNNLKALAYYFYLRGKVLKELCKLRNIKFPTNFVEKLTKSQESIPMYSCIGDLIQECVGSFRKAYECFKMVGDDIGIAKAVSNIAATYLDRVFAPVALMHASFEDLSRFPHYENSKTLTNRHSSTVSENQSSPSSNPKSPADKRPTTPIPSTPTEKKDFVLTYDTIEHPATLALDVCADTCNLKLCLKRYVNGSE